MLNLDKLKNIELVLFDVDGTLVNDYGELGERTKKIIMNLKKFGVNFSFASGRLHSALIPLAEELKLYSPLISLDGTVIKSIAEKDFVYRSYLKENHVKKAIELSERYMVNIALCHNDVIYYTEQNSVIPKLMDKFGAPYQEVESYDNLTDKTLELVFASDNRPAVAYIRDKFIFPFSLGISISFFRSQTHDNIYYLEIRRSGSSKGKAMKRLLKHLKIQEEKTAVLGDWYNDISMFESKALKIAPANAISELKRKADIVLKKSNNEEAAAVFLEKLLKVKMS